MNFRMITYILGWILVFEALFMAVPIITAVIYAEPVVWTYVACAGICAATGGIQIAKKPKKTSLYAREGEVIVALSWITLALFGALPLWISGEIPSFVNALFETASGFTTTGASILSDVEALSMASRMWRSFTHWVGGMGVLVFIMAFLPLSGAQNMHIMKAESPGPSVSKLVPRVKTTALLLYSIYIVLTLAEFVLLLFGGLSIYESLNISFSTAGTGGFSIYNSGMSGFSPYVQIVVIVFMLLCAVNFGCFFLLMAGRIKDAFTTEVRTFLAIVACSSIIIAFNTCNLYDSFGDAFRNSLFTVSSIISTTGFATVDFNQWPELSRTLVVMLTFIGACAGSTGGGFKISRLIILVKSVGKALQNMVHPHQVKKIKIDKQPIEHDVVRAVNVYMVCYLLVFLGSLLAVSCFENNDLVTNFTAVLTAMNNVGPGLELVGPMENFNFFSNPSKIVLIFDMIAGRLELFPMLLLFTPATWKK